MLIRKAVSGDVAALSALAQETYTAAFGDSMSAIDLAAHLDKNLSPVNIARMLAVDTILLAEAEARPIGFVQFGVADSSFGSVSKTDQELRRLYVLSDYQNQGIGALLIEAALEHPTMRDTERIYLDVWEHNQGAQRFYARYGFKVTGKRAFLVESGAQTSLDLIMLRERSSQKV